MTRFFLFFVFSCPPYCLSLISLSMYVFSGLAHIQRGKLPVFVDIRAFWGVFHPHH